jgi:hypothetical protein
VSPGVGWDSMRNVHCKQWKQFLTTLWGESPAGTSPSLCDLYSHVAVDESPVWPNAAPRCWWESSHVTQQRFPNDGNFTWWRGLQYRATPLCFANDN